MEEGEKLTKEMFEWIQETIRAKHRDEHNYTMTQETRDYVGASLRLPGYHNNSMRRRILRNAEKNHNRRVVEGRRSKIGLSHYITGKDS